MRCDQPAQATHHRHCRARLCLLEEELQALLNVTLLHLTVAAPFTYMKQIPGYLIHKHCMLLLIEML